MSKRRVPDWTEEERRLFLVIARRRKEEHVSAYAVVGIGAQLFSVLPDELPEICVADDGDIEYDDDDNVLSGGADDDAPPSSAADA